VRDGPIGRSKLVGRLRTIGWRSIIGDKLKGDADRSRDFGPGYFADLDLSARSENEI
jgi:hypothetical protein